MIQMPVDAPFVLSPQQTRQDFIPTFTGNTEEAHFTINTEAEGYIIFSFRPTEGIRSTSQENTTSSLEVDISVEHKFAVLTKLINSSNLTRMVEAATLATNLASLVEVATLSVNLVRLTRLEHLAASLAKIASITNMTSRTSLSVLLEEASIRTHHTIVPKRTNAYLAGIYEEKMAESEAQGRRYIDVDLTIDDDGEEV